MPTPTEKRVVVLLSVLFVFLFHRQPIGLNLLLFEAVTIVWWHYSGRIRLRQRPVLMVYVGLWLTALAVVLSYSTFAIVINLLTYGLFVGLLLAPGIRSLPYAWMLSLSNLVMAPVVFFSRRKDQAPPKGPGRYLWRFRIFLIPLAIIALFVAFYAGSNPFFNELTEYVGDGVSEAFRFVFGKLDAWIIFTWLLGFGAALFSVVRFVNRHWEEKDATSPETLQRIRRKTPGKRAMNALRNELRAAVFLLFVLNLIILVLNAIDVYWVWFHFEWNGAYLKQFVHEGTYLLILSILISIVIVLYFFRNNLNHYRRNRTLRLLSYAWLAQNAVLVVSVAIRNFWYIHYFSLAYKRIGVIVFLLLTLYGIFTVIQKVRLRKTGYHLVKVNACALFVVLVLCTLPNWDVWMARYNFRHYQTAFVHLDFLVTLSDKALPDLDKTQEELKQIERLQAEKFAFQQAESRGLYMTSESYYEHIQFRKKAFMEKWKQKSWLSWNLPEYLAYRRLSEK